MFLWATMPRTLAEVLQAARNSSCGCLWGPFTDWRAHLEPFVAVEERWLLQIDDCSKEWYYPKCLGISVDDDHNVFYDCPIYRGVWSHGGVHYGHMYWPQLIFHITVEWTDQGFWTLLNWSKCTLPASMNRGQHIGKWWSNGNKIIFTNVGWACQAPAQISRGIARGMDKMISH